MMSWDKDVTVNLLQEGLTREQAGVVVGILAEHRQIADLQGYSRGFKAGCDHVDEAREAARWLYSMAEDRESANAVSRWPWLRRG